MSRVITVSHCADRDALAADNARLRRALELGECYMKVFRHELARNNATFEGSEDQAEVDGDLAKVQAALAAPPAQSLAAHDAALLREVMNLIRQTTPDPVDGVPESFGAHQGRMYAIEQIGSEADRREQEAQRG